MLGKTSRSEPGTAEFQWRLIIVADDERKRLLTRGLRALSCTPVSSLTAAHAESLAPGGEPGCRVLAPLQIPDSCYERRRVRMVRVSDTVSTAHDANTRPPIQTPLDNIAIAPNVRTAATKTIVSRTAQVGSDLACVAGMDATSESFVRENVRPPPAEGRALRGRTSDRAGMSAAPSESITGYTRRSRPESVK